MTTSVIFRIDKKIKEQAQKIARERGMTYSGFLKLASYQLVEGDFKVAIRPNEVFKPSVRKMIDKSIEDIKAGRNLSPKFHTADEFMDYLEKDIKKKSKNRSKK